MELRGSNCIHQDSWIGEECYTLTQTPSLSLVHPCSPVYMYTNKYAPTFFFFWSRSVCTFSILYVLYLCLSICTQSPAHLWVNFLSRYKEYIFSWTTELGFEHLHRQAVTQTRIQAQELHLCELVWVQMDMYAMLRFSLRKKSWREWDVHRHAEFTTLDNMWLASDSRWAGAWSVLADVGPSAVQCRLCAALAIPLIFEKPIQ